MQISRREEQPGASEGAVEWAPCDSDNTLPLKPRPEHGEEEAKTHISKLRKKSIFSVRQSLHINKAGGQMQVSLIACSLLPAALNDYN